MSSDTPKNMVRVRFAPSPTGFGHVGGLRTALYNYLFAKKHGGVFILRIEDTDQKRFVEGALENTITYFKAFDLLYAEGPIKLEDKGDQEATLSSRFPGIVEIGAYGPYIQSERLDLYKQHAEKLLNQGKAYFCFCTEERLAAIRKEQIERKEAARYDQHCLTLAKEDVDRRRLEGTPAVIRFHVPDGRGMVQCADLIHGSVSFEASLIEDFVILKSDGYPTYHLANVVDDNAMVISHVFRTAEWLPSLPKHVLLYEAFGFAAPYFAHLPFILGQEGKKKLSKRDGDVSVDYFFEAGYLKEALLNFIALLGWNPGKGSTQEIFSIEELIVAFDLSQINKAGAVFDRKKLDWMNHQYILKKTPEELLTLVQEGKFLEGEEWFSKAPAEFQTDNYLKKVLTVEQERLITLAQTGRDTPFFFTHTLEYPTKRLVWKENMLTQTKEAIEKSHTLLNGVTEADWTRENLQKILMEAAGEKRGDFLWPLRVALTGAERSPSPMDVAWVLGKEESLKRLALAIQKVIEN